jgi:hypothetical protein
MNTCQKWDVTYRQGHFWADWFISLREVTGGKTMVQIPRPAPEHQEQQQHSTLMYLCITLFLSIICWVAVGAGISYGFQAAFGRQSRPATAHAVPLNRHVQVNESIILNQPGYQKDWPAYSNSNIVVPAYSLVTVTIRNYDLGDTPLPSGSPFNTVQGIVGGVAYANGHAYSSLAPDKVAHTFTVPQLHISVPVPGDTAKGMPYVQVTFTFRTGAAGSYYFRCFDPCGTGPSGWNGPMLTKGYMLGTLTVQG